MKPHKNLITFFTAKHKILSRVNPLKKKFNLILSASLSIFLCFSMIGCVSLKGSLGGHPTLDGHIDKFPRNIDEKSIENQAKDELERIKKLIANNQSVLDNLTFEEYLKAENKKKLVTNLDKLKYRQGFVEWLGKRYDIK